ncbi:hypothetical protein [Longitalea luteola]|uniref:hypothetical protein n=1 Tax=Longitalea luteola TaxID=2812563 RepID=UPI001A96DBAC|nr:hypothetical protein [Longitalea luteola]
MAPNNNLPSIEQLAMTPGVDEDTPVSNQLSPNAATAIQPISGMYKRSSPSLLPASNGQGEDLVQLMDLAAADIGMREELRLDVDGSLPQNVASGTIIRALNSRVHWIAKLMQEGPNTWLGTVVFKEGNLGAFPYTNVKIMVRRAGSLLPQSTKVIFSGGGAPNAERAYEFVSPFFRKVEFEFDFVKGVTPALTMDTHAHPNRPANLPKEKLSIAKVFQRAGFQVTESMGGGALPISGAGSDARWSDMEMHDAMQKFWSRFRNKPQWSMWVFFAALHEEGQSLGGIMFDDIGGNHRQGTAIFTQSFITQAPANDPAPAAWVERMKFWCAIHEMGHAFNLAHSWQKALGTPWIPLSNEPEARSFMNYPYNVSGGQTAFFANFRYAFSNNELLFMRHAPEQYVQMGNAAWFDHHGFEQANLLAEPSFRLDLRVQRKGINGVEAAPVFEFLEPVVLELKLTNVTGQPLVVPVKLLSPSHHLTVIVKRRGQPAKEVIPYATYCWQPEHKALHPGESIYDSLFTSVGKGGWDIAEPGYYTVQVALHYHKEDVLSNPLTIRVKPPKSYNEELLAQDFFSEEVGRILTFDGSQVLEGGNNVVKEVIEQLPDSNAAVHCRIAQANAVMKEYKGLVIPAGAEEEMQSLAASNSAIRTAGANLDEARKLLSSILDNPEAAAEILGNIDLNYYLTRFSKALQEEGEKQQAAEVLDTLADGLTARGALDKVVDEVKEARMAIAVPKSNGSTRSVAKKNGDKKSVHKPKRKGSYK